MTDTPRRSIRVDPETWAGWQTEADRLGVSVSEMLRRSVEWYLNPEDLPTAIREIRAVLAKRVRK